MTFHCHIRRQRNSVTLKERKRKGKRDLDLPVQSRKVLDFASTKRAIPSGRAYSCGLRRGRNGIVVPRSGLQSG